MKEPICKNCKYEFGDCECGSWEPLYLGESMTILTPEQAADKHLSFYSPGQKEEIIAAMREYASTQSQIAWEAGCLKLLEQISTEFQQCPKCGGQGMVSKPPFIAGDVTQWASTASSFTCNVCNGAKIIPRPNCLSFPIPPYPGTDNLIEREKKEAVDFAEWISINYEAKPVGLWRQYCLPTLFTTEEIYDKFKNRPA